MLKKKKKKIGDNILLEQRGDISIIYISNNLSYQTADELREAYEQIQDNKLLFDLGQIKVTTSRGMATLVRIILESYDKGRPFCLCNASGMFMTIVEAMDLITHVPNLKIVDTIDDGMEYLS